MREENPSNHSHGRKENQEEYIIRPAENITPYFVGKTFPSSSTIIREEAS